MPAEGKAKQYHQTTLGQGWFFISGDHMSRIIIFANGSLSQPDLLRRYITPTDRIFCADGGAQNALALGLTPAAVIGDLDSLPADLVSQLEARGVTIQRHPRRKDQTDLELAFDLAVAAQPDEIMLVTALGGRLDQMLANILLLTRPAYASVRLTLADGPQRAILVRSHQVETISGQPGDTLSLIPLTPQVTQVDFLGVEWPLAQATLSLGSTWSISNVLVDRQATVQIGEGLVLLVHLDQSDQRAYD
jgi:thiamine pyrophosphokinase